MDDAERARRQRAWDALADAFLDTETRWYYPRIASVLAACGYTDEELEHIWHHEMVPECASNLMQVAGEWAMLTLDYEALERRAEQPTVRDRLGAAVAGAASGAVLGRTWPAILGLRAVLAGLDDAERARREKVFTAFAHFYIEEDRKGLLFPETHEANLRSAAYSATELRRIFEEEFRPVYRQLLFGTDEAVHAAMITRLLDALGTP